MRRLLVFNRIYVKLKNHLFYQRYATSTNKYNTHTILAEVSHALTYVCAPLRSLASQYLPLLDICMIILFITPPVFSRIAVAPLHWIYLSHIPGQEPYHLGGQVARQRV